MAKKSNKPSSEFKFEVVGLIKPFMKHGVIRRFADELFMMDEDVYYKLPEELRECSEGSLRSNLGVYGRESERKVSIRKIGSELCVSWSFIK